MRKIIKGVLGILVVAGLVFGVMFWFSPVKKLERLGYTNDEARRLVAMLDNPATKELLSHDYSEDFLKLLDAPEFDAKKFPAYITALEQNHLSPENTVLLVNHPDYDESKKYTSSMLEIMREKYYLPHRRERYFQVLENSLASANEIVALVNANRDREFYTKTEPANPDDGDLILVNKYYYLTEDFVPELEELGAMYGTVGVLLSPVAKTEFLEMNEAALEAGFKLYATSGYRGYNEQEEVYHSWVVTEGEEKAKDFAALPGYSEHQTGLVLDVFTIGETTTSFAETAAAKWLSENAWRYGFILRYPKEAEKLTGYNYEAWHFRYVGREAAAEIYQQNLTLEEYWALKHPNS